MSGHGRDNEAYGAHALAMICQCVLRLTALLLEHSLCMSVLSSLASLTLAFGCCPGSLCCDALWNVFVLIIYNKALFVPLAAAANALSIGTHCSVKGRSETQAMVLGDALLSRQQWLRDIARSRVHLCTCCHLHPCLQRQSTCVADALLASPLAFPRAAFLLKHAYSSRA